MKSVGDSAMIKRSGRSRQAVRRLLLLGQRLSAPASFPRLPPQNDRVFIVYVAQEGEKQSVWLVTADEAKLDSGQARTLYDPDPNHIWNQGITQIGVATCNFK